MSLSDYQKRRELNNKKIIERIIMSRNYHKFDGLKQYYDEIERKFEIDKKELSNRRYDIFTPRIFFKPFMSLFVQINKVRVEVGGR